MVNPLPTIAARFPDAAPFYVGYVTFYFGTRTVNLTFSFDKVVCVSEPLVLAIAKLISCFPVIFTTAMHSGLELGLRKCFLVLQSSFRHRAKGSRHHFKWVFRSSYTVLRCCMPPRQVNGKLEPGLEPSTSTVRPTPGSSALEADCLCYSRLASQSLDCTLRRVHICLAEPSGDPVPALLFLNYPR